MKQPVFNTFILLSMLLSNMSGYALNNYYFNIISRDKGLSQTNVKAIIQDSNGFMWFGTRNKLNRYDGNTFKVFDCYDHVAQKQNNNISSLFEDKEKQLWVGTDNGVFRLNPQTGIFTYMNTQTSEGITMTDWISDIKEDKDGNIWIVVPNQGLFRYLQNSKELKFYAFGRKSVPDHGNPQSICIDQSNRVWIGTNGKGVYLYNKNTNQFNQYLGDTQGNTLAGENIYTMADDGEFLILGIHEGKLRKIHKKEKYSY
ncbi:MAG: two-component regulator propeller domain-containing protein [Bacteroides faecis]